ncbi:FMN-dependent NADH-azoreductase [Laceyella tengchongensis]|uniref:FMN-dependent NADH-azoreductase n=1 Tax=Laceyella tengchongensis TaxID=574699 RepID=UPI0012B999E5|nr:FMN-dependent NADH-azoreductase [Laceyella tengchongensis]
MARVLYITANPKTEMESFSLSIAKEFLGAYQQVKPNDEIMHLDLYKVDIPYIDADLLNSWSKLRQGIPFEELSNNEQTKVSRINKLTDQFVNADKYVFVTPMWNLSVPPKMKAYIDVICIAGKTFKYTEQGSVGLLTNKKAVHIQARGGIYSESPMKELEFGDRFVKAICNFMGITDIESIIAEGMAQMPQEAGNIKAKAIDYAKEVAIRFAQ